MLNLYTTSQSEYIKKNLDKLAKAAAKQKLLLLEPTIDEYKKVMNIIKDYIRKKKRIIYGGYAINALLINKNKNEGIYDDDLDTPDIEFYTPDPINDLIEICNELEDKKFKFVLGKSAQHKETYSVFVNFEGYCDISYVPKIVYNNIPTIKIDGILMTHPKYVFIDRLREFTDPITSGWRWEKQFSRMALLQQYYPFKDESGKLHIQVDNKHKSVVQEILEKHIKGNDTLILFNYFAYNYYIEKSRTNDFSKVDIPYLDIISINYVDDCKKLCDFMQKLYPNEIQTEEYYPFFQFYGYKFTIKFKDKLMINVYDNNHKCVPYTKTEDDYNIVSFSYILLMLLILQQRTIIDKDKNKNENYNKMFSNLLIIRNKYLDTHNKTVIDDTPFKEFQVACKGTTLSQARLYRLDMEKKRNERKRLAFYYHPNENRNKQKEDASKFLFKNTSGNLIRNPKNKKISSCK